MKRRWLLLLLPTLAIAEPQAGFPFVIPSGSAFEGVGDFSDLNSRPAGADGFVRRDGDHLTLPPNQAARMLCALTPAGGRLAEIPGKLNPDGSTTFEIDQGAQSLWFELAD